MKFLKIFLLFIAGTNLLVGSVNILEDMEIQKDELRLHFSHLLNKTNVHHFSLEKPYRKVFDIRNARLSPKNLQKNLKGPQGTTVRISQYQKDIVRLVIECNKPFMCNSYQPMLSKKSYHIPLPKTAFASTRERADIIPKKTTRTYNNAPAKKEEKGFLDSVFGKKISSGPSDHEVIVIDAGHGGHDSGAVGGGKKEKDLVLQISKKLAKELQRHGYTVYLTRSTDRFLKLTERTKIADIKNAKVFVSVHANAAPNERSKNKMHGVETFFLQNTSDERSQRVAARENEAVLKGTDNLSKNVIVDSVLSGPKIVQSHKLAIDVQKNMLGSLRSRFDGVKDGGVRSAPFWVLVGASRPSILVEVGYISHPVERKQLFTTRYQDLVAKGIAEGIGRYLYNRKREIDL
ncbi:MAG: N-acetylmuramoyl-L-alanine amidase [Campylobacterota bacterium]|nr:N-acetylmuramoyl-L-alanine amidase [Campylobacterota bacterium]